jgi:hypothetical protein
MSMSGSTSFGVNNVFVLQGIAQRHVEAADFADLHTAFAGRAGANLGRASDPMITT